MSEDLRGQRMLVIGGSSGIGEATAARAAAGGARVTIASRSAERLVAALQRLPAGIQSAVLDVCDAAAVAAFFADRPAWHHVVLAGSATRVGPVRVLALEDAQAAMQNKFWGAYHVGRSAVVAEGGSLTFVSGVYAQRPAAGAVLQGAVNAAVESLARGLALELAPAVRVNTVSPSTTATPLWDRLGAEGRAARFADMAAHLPLRRVAEPDDIARAICFLASSPFSTGSTVVVDGGDMLA